MAPTSRESLAAPANDLLEIFGALQSTASGISVSVEQAIRVPAVHSAIRVIAEAAGSLDVMVKRVNADGSESDEPDHPVSKLLRGDVNDWTSGTELVTDLVCDALVSDNGGTAYVNRTGDGRIIEIVRYNRGIVTVERDQETAEPTFRIADRVIPTQDALHLRSPLGRAPLSLAREAIGVAIILERHAARLFARGARPSGVLSFVNGMKEEAIRKTRAAWQSAHEGEDAGGKTAVLHDGATFTPLTLTSTDAQFLELRKFQILEIARAFRVPPSMLFELDRATWSNSEQMGREFLTYCLEPWLIALEAAMRRALFLPEERERFVIRFDRDDLTRADLTARATAINSLIASRVISPNEGRAWIGLAPREGGDAFQNPNITPEKPAPAKEDPADA